MSALGSNSPPPSSAESARREGAVAQPASTRFIKPRLKPAATHGPGAPAGSLHPAPAAAPVPEKGTGFLLTLSLIAAGIAVIFTLMLALKL